jgi:SAM-dependent methyltransferase/uncharacterized protein YbaR (Trm112 family)
MLALCYRWYNAPMIDRTDLTDAQKDLRQELLNTLICPEDGSPLTGWDGFSPTGTLKSAGGRTFPVVDGIACILPDALREAPLNPDGSADGDVYAEKRQEMQTRDEQSDDYDKMVQLNIFDNFEVPMTIKALSLEPDNLLLEGGCGTGRMTNRFAERVRGLVAVDFSLASVQKALRKTPPEMRHKILFVQADLSRLPTKTGVFDRVGSFGVHEHIPSAEARADTIGHYARILKPRSEGSRFAISTYRWGFPLTLTSKKEGHHEPGHIYFYRMTTPEVREHIGTHFEIGGHQETLLYYHLIWGRKKG